MDALVRGEYATRTVTILDGDGDALDLTGASVYFTATRRLSDAAAAALISKETGAGIEHLTQSGDTVGQATITFDPADTSSLEAYRVDLHFAVWAVIATHPYPTQRGTLTVNSAAANPA